MDLETKQKLERLRKENKIKIAKELVISALNKFYHIDISRLPFAEYKLSERVHTLVYEKIKEDDVKIEKFHFDYSVINEKLEWLFNVFKSFESDKVLLFPTTFAFNLNASEYPNIDFGIAIISTIKEFKGSIIKLIYDIRNDLIVVEENLEYGFVISIDEYSDISIEYWVI
jgi:hypothetical protein